MNKFYGTYWIIKLMQEGKTFEELKNKDAWINCKDGSYDASKWAYEWFMKWAKEFI